MISNKNNQERIQVETDVAVLSATEEVIPMHPTHDNSSKGDIVAIEDASDEKVRDEEDPNSPWAILQRYPLLRNMSQNELDILNRKVRRRLDIRLLPMLTLMLIINYLDRSNVTNARVAGMQDDLGMTDVQWSAGISMFYAGYMVTQLPGTLILSKYKPRVVLPLLMLGWSLPTIMFPLVKNAAGFTCARFIVGVCEGPFFPGVALMTSSWYVSEELPFRMALWHGAQTISNTLGGPFAAAVLENMQDVAGLHAWQWFMLIEGILSIAVAIAAYFSLPNWAHNTPWLQPEESEMAQYRLVLSAGGNDEEAMGLSLWAGTKMAAKDWFTWLFVLMHFWLVCAQSFKDFLPSILDTMSTSKLMTYLLQSPCYLLGYFSILFFGWMTGKTRNSVWNVVIPLLFSIAGTIMMITTLNTAARYIGVCLLIMGVYSGLNIQVSWETQIVPSPRHKKAALIALANMFSSSSHWFTPYFFLRNQEPLYRLGGGLILFSLGISIIVVFVIRQRVIILNGRLDRAEDEVNADRVARGLEPKQKGWRFTQ